MIMIKKSTIDSKCLKAFWHLPALFLRTLRFINYPTISLFSALLLFCLSFSFATTIQEVRPSCDGSGFMGTAEDNGVIVHFEGCPTETGYHSKIWKPTGERVTEVIYDTATGDVTYWIGDKQVTEATTEAEEQQNSPPMKALGGNLTQRVGFVMLKIAQIE